jgi:hypothetical protein
VSCSQSLLRFWIWLPGSALVWARLSLGAVATLTTSTPSGRATNLTCTRARAACSRSILGRIMVWSVRVRVIFTGKFLREADHHVKDFARKASNFRS